MSDLLRVSEYAAFAYRFSTIIRADGTIAPCFPMYSANHDWGTIEAPKMA